MENEKRLIDANALVKIAEKRCGVVNIKHIDDCPTVDAVEVVHGRNLDADTPSLFECSVCHWSCNDTYYGDTADYNYCPNCGAKMDGGNDDA